MRRLLFLRIGGHCRRCSSSAAEDPQLVSLLSQLLSTHRRPSSPLTVALSPLAGQIISSPSSLPSTLIRCRNLHLPSLRLFLFCAAIPTFSIPPTTLPIIASTLAAAPDGTLLLSLLSDFPPLAAELSSPAVAAALFRGLVRARRPDVAVDLFHCNPGCSGSDECFRLLLSALCRRGFVDHAAALFESARTSCGVDRRSYTILINGYARSGDYVKARELFDELPDSGLGLDVSVYNALVMSYCNGGEVGEANRTVREMKTVHGFAPDAATYGAFLRAACSVGDVSAAMRVLEKMGKKGMAPNVFTYNAVIRMMCGKGDVEAAYRVLEEMTDRGQNPDVWSYNTVMSMHCRLREVNKALRLIARMDRDKCLPDRKTYNMLLKLLVSVGRIDRASEVWEGMGRRGFHPGVATYSVMIHGLCRRKGYAEEACRFLELMLAEGMPPYAETCKLIRERLVRIGLHERLELLADRMRRSSSIEVRELAGIVDGSSKELEGGAGGHQSTSEADDEQQGSWISEWKR